MASKWLAAFLETDDVSVLTSTERAVSADSANSPPTEALAPPTGTNGAIGTSEQTSEQAEPPEADIEERAALIEFAAGVPRRWAEGYAALTAITCPAGFSPERWRRTIEGAGRFLDRWAFEAARCGWSDLDVFGCDDAQPDARFDAMGLALLLDRAEVVAIDPEGADLRSPAGDVLRYRRRPLPPGTVSLWDLQTR